MKRVFLSILVLLSFLSSRAQQDSIKEVISLPITDYMQKISDSVLLVQVEMPGGLGLPLKQVGILHSIYRSREDDTASIGIVRCQLIKGNYYYFTVVPGTATGREARAGDLIRTQMRFPAIFHGQLFGLVRHSIYLQTVQEEALYSFEDIVINWDRQKEDSLIKKMVEDIQYTGREMLKQMPAQNTVIAEGLFKGKKLFDAMQQTDVNAMIEFLKYVNARPTKYAGHTWKISEIFATWMISGAPQVLEK
jgi:hypothetical protein